jgi:hypothetical protein
VRKSSECGCHNVTCAGLGTGRRWRQARCIEVLAVTVTGEIDRVSVRRIGHGLMPHGCTAKLEVQPHKAR